MAPDFQGQTLRTPLSRDYYLTIHGSWVEVELAGTEIVYEHHVGNIAELGGLLVAVVAQASTLR